jgi:branched-chain amino acid transport system substrate-binding protein
MRAELRRRLAPAVRAGFALALTFAAAACGGAGGGTITVGVLSYCTGAYSQFGEQMAAGAELPLIERGAKLRGRRPFDGITDATVAGKRVRLLLGCVRYDEPGSNIAESRRLVEQDGARLLIGSLFAQDGLLLREYAWREPGIAFLSTDFTRSVTLTHPASNLFRFEPDYAQTVAGLGAYAYHELGWRRVATIGEDDPPGYGQVAGFAAEFCPLGGSIAKRLWAPGYVTDFKPFVARIANRGIDGVFITHGDFKTDSFFSAYGRLHPHLARRVVAVTSALPALTDRMLGVVTAWAGPWQPTTSLLKYAHAFAKAFPDVQGGTDVSFDFFYYDTMTAALQALEKVHGDISGGERRLMAALGTAELHSPVGLIRLDRDRQAIEPNYLLRVEKTADGKLVNATFRVIPNVEQSFGGYFRVNEPPSSRTYPACHRANPPTWARSR